MMLIVKPETVIGWHRPLVARRRTNHQPAGPRVREQLRHHLPDEVDVAHPLDGGRAGILHQSLEETGMALGEDGRTWRRAFGPLAAQSAELADSVLGPVARIPAHPLAVARFGL